MAQTTRREFLERTAYAAGMTGMAAALPAGTILAEAADAAARRSGLPAPRNVPIDHFVVLMMENRSFDHYFGWVPGADAVQNQTYTDPSGASVPTRHFSTLGTGGMEYKGCGHPDPGHGWDSGRAQLLVYPTLFLVDLTDDAELEAALCKAYNSWLGDACNKSKGRLKFVAILPLRSIPESLKEMKRAKDLGAVGIFFRGIEGDKTIDHPYFHPVYEQAAKLDMAICIHTGSGAPWMLPDFEHARNHTFAHGRALPIFAFRDLIANRIPEKFPGLRIGFIEASARWAPFMMHILRRLFKDRPKFKNSAELFRDYNLFIAREADEDIPYLAKCIGEDNIVIGSGLRSQRPIRRGKTGRDSRRPRGRPGKRWRKRSWYLTRADCMDCSSSYCQVLNHDGHEEDRGSRGADEISVGAYGVRPLPDFVFFCHFDTERVDSFSDRNSSAPLTKHMTSNELENYVAHVAEHFKPNTVTRSSKPTNSAASLTADSARYTATSYVGLLLNYTIPAGRYD